MHDSERYADSAHLINIDGQMVRAVWCARQRCMHKIVLQKPLSLHGATDNTWRYPHYAVVVSMEDGTKKMVFCSARCASMAISKMKVST